MDRRNRYTSATALLMIALIWCSCNESNTSNETSLPIDATWLESTNQYGHTGVLIQTDDLVLYLDPVDLVSLEDLPVADVILITHDHGDHYSQDTIAALSNENTKVVSTAAIADALTDMESHAIEPGESVSVAGLEIEGIAAHNTYHPEKMLYLGFVFSIDGVRIYCSGDTALNDEILGLSGIDVAFLNVRPIYSLGGEAVVQFAEEVEPQVVVPIHWMPDDDTWNDAAAIDHIEQNLPDSVTLEILDLE